MVVQVDPVGVGVKWTFDIYDFPSVASTMWVCMDGEVCISALKHDLNGSGFKDWSLQEYLDSWKF